MTVITGDHYMIHVGDVRQAAGSVHCVVTSPPYWGLRDYGFEGQIGSEETPDQFVQVMVEVFREVKRILRDDGVLWVNLGDSYAANKGQRKSTDIAGRKQSTNEGSIGAPSRHVSELDAGNKIGIPWRVALALQADGWILRQDVIWAKPSPSMTTGQVAINLGCEFIAIEGNSEYVELGLARLNTPWVPVAEKRVKKQLKRRRLVKGQKVLFG